MSSCGLDFGTSNTTLGTFDDGVPVLARVEAEHFTIPSAIFYASDGGVTIGRRAIASYVDGVTGRLMRSLKSVLGTTLIDETTRLGPQRLSYRAVIAAYIGAVKRHAEQATGRALRQVVHGRPVHFADHAPEADRKAEAALLAIAREIGFEEVTFQFEPIAAALDYERQIADEQVALIADIGGGTSDFSIVRLGPQRRAKPDRGADILANDGLRVGGTDFDRQLSLARLMPLFGYRSAMKRAELSVPSGYFYDLATWSSINRLYDAKVAAGIRQVRFEAAEPQLLDRLLRVLDEQRGHTLAMEIEETKIALSETQRAAIALDWIEPGLRVNVSRAALVKATQPLVRQISARIARCLGQAQLQAADIDAVFLTGGSVRMPHVRDAIVAALPNARAVDGDAFGAVGKGLTIEAQRRYGPA